VNKPIRSLALFCLFLFLALLLNVTYLQFFASGKLNDDPRNRRILAEAYSRERGTILVGKEPIARSESVDDEYQFLRIYDKPLRYAHVTGYFSYFSTSGVERVSNDFLSGNDERLFVARVIDLLGNSQPKGGSVSLTINSAAQDAAYDGLSGLGENVQGAVVALEPDTGKILAMVSLPSYDPNELASHNFSAVTEASNQLNKAETEPLVNRAMQTTLPPGSTFKLVTAAAAIEQKNLAADSPVPGGDSYTLPGSQSELDNGGRNCAGEQISLTQAVANSCNTTFLQLGVELGEERVAEQAEAFGFNTDQPYLTDLPSQARSVFPTGLDDAQTALSSIGQFDVRATPLQMAMVAAGIANDGVVMKPYLVDKMTSPNLDVLEAREGDQLSRAVDPSTAQVLTEVMVTTVSEGTGTPAQIPGIEVAGKTGTAQGSEDRPPYAWFVGFAPANDPEVAVAVLVETSDTARDEIAGGALGGPIAKAVMEAVLNG
jgi:penicillin-binding protein A